VTPEELTLALEAANLRVTDRQGVVYNPLRDQWSLARDMSVNYMVLAARNEADPAPTGGRAV
jgi:2-polyprenyl-6-hydroxyphenyl methylase / 3-demethylubiquinone-9 3-methyltransferase